MSGVPIENFYSNHYLKTTIMSLLYSKNFPNDWTKEKINKGAEYVKEKTEQQRLHVKRERFTCKKIFRDRQKDF